MSPPTKGFFRFNRREKAGILALAILLLALFLWQAKSAKINPVQSYDSAELDRLWNKLDSLDQMRTDSWKENKTSKKRKDKEILLEAFDPNELGLEAWMDLGFSEKQSLSILKYAEKSGGFRIKSDLSKPFVISPQKFKSLEPFLLLPDTLSERIEKSNWKRPNKTIVSLEINRADSSTWDSLPGIGPVLSARIIKYRLALGGFESPRQLTEVYGISDSLVAVLDEHIHMDSVSLEKLNVNQLSASDLKKHPYIDWQMANAIVKYREQHGDYKELEDLLNLHLIETKFFQKIKNYLTL